MSPWSSVVVFLQITMFRIHSAIFYVRIACRLSHPGTVWDGRHVVIANDWRHTVVLWNVASSTYTIVYAGIRAPMDPTSIVRMIVTMAAYVFCNLKFMMVEVAADGRVIFMGDAYTGGFTIPSSKSAGEVDVAAFSGMLSRFIAIRGRDELVYMVSKLVIEQAVHLMALCDRPASAIARQWRQCISNPEYALCRRRLLREHGELVPAFLFSSLRCIAPKTKNPGTCDAD